MLTFDILSGSLGTFIEHNDDRGKCAPIGGAHRSATMRTHNLQKPARLYWDISPKLAGIIENAVRVAQKAGRWGGSPIA